MLQNTKTINPFMLVYKLITGDTVTLSIFIVELFVEMLIMMQVFFSTFYLFLISAF